MRRKTTTTHNSYAALLLLFIISCWAAPQCCYSLPLRSQQQHYPSTWATSPKREVSLDDDGDNNLSAILTSIRGGGGGRRRRSSSESTTTTTNHKRLVVLLVATALFNDMLQLTMLLPIIHTLVSSPPPLGVTNNKEVALGLFFASKDICQMASAPFAGVLCTKFSPQVALISSIVGLGLATIVFAEATTFYQLLLARGAQGAASAAVLCGGLSLIAETHSQNVRGKAMGLAQSGLAAGMLTGPLIGGLLFERLGRKNTFRFAAGMVLANAVAMILLMGVAPPESSSSSSNDDDGRREKNDTIISYHIGN